MSIDYEGSLRLLRDAVKHLAAEAEQQIQFLTAEQLGDADELALDLDAIAGTMPSLVREGFLSQETADIIQGLDKHLESFSGEVNAHLWSFEALSRTDEWQTARRLARSALKSWP
jgi:hypothetical protein